MNKTEFSFTLPFVAFALAFAAVSFMLYLSGGKSSYWLKKKMKIGAIMLTMSAASVGYQGCITTCYDMPAQNDISIDNLANYEIRVNLQENKYITGTIYERISTEFYFRITDTAYTKTFQLEQLKADDGAMDESSEKFTIMLSDSLESGIYMLNFYDYKVLAEDSAYASYPSFRLIVENNRP
jgi:hypothetical protein